MIAAAGAAVIAPLHLFLAAYAFLGPLHYLTEISWLHDRGYFVSRERRRSLWLGLVMTALVVMVYGYVQSDLLHRPVGPALEIGLFYGVFVAAAIVLFIRHVANVIAAFILAIVAVTLFSTNPIYGIAAYLLITIIHVFIFTGVFLITGAMKARSWSGYVSVAVFLSCAVAALFLRSPFVVATERLRDTYAPFAQLNELLLHLIGAGAASPAAGVMQFIAFAYTYHYLNWFSKTSIIKWHEVGRIRALGIVLAWIAGTIVYVVNYRAGFALFYVMSVAHVMLEFPLNHQSVASLGRSLRSGLWREGATTG